MFAGTGFILKLLSIDNPIDIFNLEVDMRRSIHPKKEVEKALKHAEAEGWRLEVGGAHAWGKLYCPYKGDECRCGEFCISCVGCTPRSAGNHANALRRVVDHCATHMKHKAAMRLAPQGE